MHCIVDDNIIEIIFKDSKVLKASNDFYLISVSTYDSVTFAPRLRLHSSYQACSVRAVLKRHVFVAGLTGFILQAWLQQTADKWFSS